MSILGRSIISFVALASLTWAGIGGGKALTQENNALLSSSLEQVLDAHGGRKAISETQAVTGKMTRVIWSAPDHFFERQMELSTRGDRFVRRIWDPLRLISQIEVYDGAGRFSAASVTQVNGDTAVREQLASDTERLADVQASNLSTGLLHILKLLIEPNATVSEALTDSNGLRRFNVATGRGVFTVYVDRLNLIRKVNLGATTMVFADAREVAPLKLPFVERVLLGGRVIFDVYFTSIEFNPALSDDYFDPSRLDRL